MVMKNGMDLLFEVIMITLSQLPVQRLHVNKSVAVRRHLLQAAVGHQVVQGKTSTPEEILLNGGHLPNGKRVSMCCSSILSQL